MSAATAEAPSATNNAVSRTDTANAVADVGVEDLFPVRSRISWGPVFAGAVVALAIYLLLTLLGTAIGATVTTRTNAATTDTGLNAVITAGVIWAIVSMLLALFAGGWVASQLSVGETPMEAAVFGIVVWGTTVAFLLFLLAAGVTSGFNAMIGMATLADRYADRTAQEEIEDTFRRRGYTQEQIDNWKESLKDLPARMKAAADDAATRQAVGNRVTAASWWTLVGTILSMAAAIGGALSGAGPRFRLLLASHARRTAITKV
jgi:hypothetical protein